MATISSEESFVHSAMSSSGAGAGYLQLINQDNEERDLFFSPLLEDCAWVQSRVQRTEVQVVKLTAPFKNVSSGGGTATAEHAKHMDHIWKGGIAMKRPAITLKESNLASHRTVSFVNAYAYCALLETILKVGSTPLFRVSGRSQLFLMDLLGRLELFGKWIGYYPNKDELIRQSRQPQSFIAPYVGMPFNERTQEALGAGYVGLLKVEFVVNVAASKDLLMYWGGHGREFRGNLPIPVNIATQEPIGDKDLSMVLLTRGAYFLKSHRKEMQKGSLETMFKELVPIVQDHSIAAWPNGDQRIEIPNITIRGPMDGILITVQSDEDIKGNNRTKFCKDNGDEHIKYAALHAGSWTREDAVMVPLQRYNVQETYPEQRGQQLAGIFLPMSHDWKHPEPQSCSDYTAGTDMKLILIVAAHKEPLIFNAEAFIWNGWWQEDLSIGKVWQS